MPPSVRNLMAQTADDLMTRHAVTVREDMPLRDAAQLLSQNQISGAPVVDAHGRCVGLLSATDFLRLCETHAVTVPLAAPRRPVTCAFQEKEIDSPGRPATRCNLPFGVCTLQMRQTGPDGHDCVTCAEPHCVLVDWQIVELEKLPLDEVRQFMSRAPVIARADALIRTLARTMVDAHVHRIVVVDEEQRPIGVVSSTDLLAALAFAEDGE